MTEVADGRSPGLIAGLAPALARSAARAARADAPGTGFEIVHITADPAKPLRAPISPGVYPPLEWDHGRISEQLSMTLLGTGVALRTSFLPPGPGPTRPVEFAAAPGAPQQFNLPAQLDAVRTRFLKLMPGSASETPLEPLITRLAGSSQANPSFLFGSSRILEVMFDQLPDSATGTGRLVSWWGQPDQLTALLAELTGAVADIRAPILFLHSSLSILPASRDSPSNPPTTMTPSATVGHVLRLGLGLPDALAGRVALLQALAHLADSAHYGLCVSDRSAGAPRGLWRRLIDAGTGSAGPAGPAAGPATLITVVAPATVGVIRSVVGVVQDAGLGILAIGAEALQEVAFVSLLLAAAATDPVPVPGAPDAGHALPGTITLSAGAAGSGREVLVRHFPPRAATTPTPRTDSAGPLGPRRETDPDPLAEAQTMVTSPILIDRVPLAAGGFVLWIGWEIVDQSGPAASDAATVVMPDAIQPAIQALRERCPAVLTAADLVLTVVYARARRASHREARGRLKVMVTHPDLSRLAPEELRTVFTQWCREAQRSTRQNLVELAGRRGGDDPARRPVPAAGATTDPEWPGPPAPIGPAVRVRVSWLEPWLGWPAGVDR